MMIRRVFLVLCVSLLGLGTAYAGKSIVVDLSTQTATAYENDVPVFSGQISTGTAKRPTPTGRFRVLEKDIDHVSSSWPKPNGGAKMHYMLRLTNYGIAMHLGFVPNYPASHGCIRMQNGFAQKMYSWAHVGVPVRVVGHAPARVYRPVKKTKRAVAKRQERRKERNSALTVLSSSPKASTVVTKTVKKEAIASLETERKKVAKTASSASYKKPTTLDILSSSPKAAKRVEEAQQQRWKNMPKRKAPRVDPLEALKA